MTVQLVSRAVVVIALLMLTVSNWPREATAISWLAYVYQAQGRYAEAEPLYKRSLAIYEKALGAEHPDVATALNNIAGLVLAQHDWAQAADHWRHATKVIERRSERGLVAWRTELRETAQVQGTLSGRYGFSSATTCESTHSIDLAWLRRRGIIKTGWIGNCTTLTWSWGGARAIRPHGDQVRRQAAMADVPQMRPAQSQDLWRTLFSLPPKPWAEVRLPE